MTQATTKTLESYRAKIKWGTERSLPAGQGMAIQSVIREYKIPAIRWGYYGSLIGVETKKQIIIWRDRGTHLDFKGVIDKKSEETNEFSVGDKVSSVGGFFVMGIVEKVEGDDLTIRWIKDSRRDEPISFVQVRDKSIVRRL